MTDEEIEKVVARCRKENCTGCKFYNLNGCLAVVEYIKGLKAEMASLTEEIAALEADNDNLNRMLDEYNEELEEKII